MLIAAGGRGERWGKCLGVPKPLITIEGETLVGRSVRLVREHSPDASLAVVASDEALRVPPVALVDAPYSDPECGLDKLCVPYWSRDGRTTVLWGDTYYTEDAMRTILGPQSTPVRFFGRNIPSEFTGKVGPELYAFTFDLDGAKLLLPAISECRYLSRRGEMGERLCLWDVYATVGRQGALLYLAGDEHAGVNQYFTMVHDWTEDFDAPQCYQDWTTRRAATGRSQEQSHYVG